MNGEEREIWRRVRGDGPGDADLKALILWAQEDIADYGALTARLRGRRRERVLTLLGEARDTLATLYGLETLAGGSPGPRPPLPAPRLGDRQLLERAFRRSADQARACTLRTPDPRFGPTFRRLAQRHEAASAALAALIGGM